MKINFTLFALLIAPSAVAMDPPIQRTKEALTEELLEVVSQEGALLNEVERLLNIGAEVEERVQLDPYETGFGNHPLLAYWGNTPLIIAAKVGNAPVCEALIQRGASVNATITAGLPSEKHLETALHWAVRYGHFDVCKVLLAHGASIFVGAPLCPLKLCIKQIIGKHNIATGEEMGNEVQKYHEFFELLIKYAWAAPETGSAEEAAQRIRRYVWGLQNWTVNNERLPIETIHEILQQPALSNDLFALLFPRILNDEPIPSQFYDVLVRIVYDATMDKLVTVGNAFAGEHSEHPPIQHLYENHPLIQLLRDRNLLELNHGEALRDTIRARIKEYPEVHSASKESKKFPCCTKGAIKDSCRHIALFATTICVSILLRLIYQAIV